MKIVNGQTIYIQGEKCKTFNVSENSFEVNLVNRKLNTTGKVTNSLNRLEKVLSKFEEEPSSIDGMVKHYYKGLLQITHYGYAKEFSLDREVISLDTVESLIKDIEGE